jgi:hypothetical protein
MRIFLFFYIIYVRWNFLSNYQNLFLNVNRQTEALTLVLSCGVEREKEKENEKI